MMLHVQSWHYEFYLDRMYEYYSYLCLCVQIYVSIYTCMYMYISVYMRIQLLDYANQMYVYISCIPFIYIIAPYNM